MVFQEIPTEQSGLWISAVYKRFCRYVSVLQTPQQNLRTEYIAVRTMSG